LKTIVVVVNEGASGSESFRQVFLPEGAAVVIEVDAAGLSDIGESKSRSRFRAK